MSKPGGLAKQESGQALTEYILLLSIILVSMSYFLKAISKTIDEMTARQGGMIERQIRTGSAPASLWNK